jgi:hypothetical protein
MKIRCNRTFVWGAALAFTLGGALTARAGTVYDGDDEGKFELSLPLENSQVVLEPSDTHRFKKTKVEGAKQIQLLLGTDAPGEPAEVEVVVNGKSAGTLKVKGEYESHQITASEPVESVEVRHRKGKKVTVYEVTVNVLVVDLAGTDYDLETLADFKLNVPSSEIALYLSRTIFVLHRSLRRDVAENSELGPLARVRQAAQNLMIVAQREKDLSAKTLGALEQLHGEMQKAHSIFVRLAGTESVRKKGILYQTIENEIKRRLERD